MSAKWECIVCGWIYDEATGDPDSGIAPGTKFEDIPEDWLCPDCGVGKEDFELIEQAEEAAAPHHESEDTDHSQAPIVIVGTGLAGVNLAKEFRKHDEKTPIIMITSDDGRFYSKPMLSTGYTRNVEPEKLVQMDSAAVAKAYHASIWTMTKVASIDTANHKLKLDDGDTEITYSKLVLCVGADVIRPPIEGDGLDYVYSCNDLMDYDDFRKAMKNNDVKKVCIIGGGLIGCEFTNDLLNGGIEVETVDPLGYCLPTLLPEIAGKAVQKGLEEKGAKFHFGPLVTAVNKAANGLEVSLNNGEKISADLVVSAVGVRPRIQLAQEAGIETNRGIVVDRKLQTSSPDVYAIGDCAEVDGHVLVYVAPLMASARALAKTLAGDTSEVAYPAMPVTIKTPACPVVVNPPPRDADGEWSFEQDGNNVVAQFRNSDGNLLGFALTGEGTKQKVALQKELPPIF